VNGTAVGDPLKLVRTVYVKMKGNRAGCGLENINSSLMVGVVTPNASSQGSSLYPAIDLTALNPK